MRNDLFPLRNDLISLVDGVRQLHPHLFIFFDDPAIAILQLLQRAWNAVLVRNLLHTAHDLLKTAHLGGQALIGVLSDHVLHGEALVEIRDFTPVQKCFLQGFGEEARDLVVAEVRIVSKRELSRDFSPELFELPFLTFPHPLLELLLEAFELRDSLLVITANVGDTLLVLLTLLLHFHVMQLRLIIQNLFLLLRSLESPRIILIQALLQVGQFLFGFGYPAGILILKRLDLLLGLVSRVCNARVAITLR